MGAGASVSTIDSLSVDEIKAKVSSFGEEFVPYTANWDLDGKTVALLSKDDFVAKLQGFGVTDAAHQAVFVSEFDKLQSTKMKIVFVLGGPGSGKGTNCAKLVETFGLVHLSAGDLLREERQSGSDLAEMINTYIAEGKIVPAEITVRLLRNAMEKSGGTKFLVDGFPRDLQNLACWEEKMTPITDLQFLLFLDCSQETMLERLLERGKTSGRNDDNLESIKKRFITYDESTRPIIEHFKSINKVKTIDSNREPDVVFEDVKAAFADV